ncbi:MAG: sulfotransferase family 2 domain-containing protein [Defluviimonas sp.]|uniref:hypothetical protein n=1 Tax=Albidovulum sp. TaxID=1872424 RepID=UPI002A31611C|nr:sulfotransferase family 2 domain-containing protein [Defluviimonas sp.]
MTLHEPDRDRTTRRSRIYSGRFRRSLFGSGLRHPAIYLHLPKCGGTSLSEALYATVPMHKRIGVIDAVSTRRAAAILEFGLDDAWKCHDDLEFGDLTFDLRERILTAHCCWDSHLIAGHVLLSERLRTQFVGRYKLLTIMRDPVARAISNYRMAVVAGIADPDPEVWLASPIARAHSTTFLRYLSGQNRIAAEQEPAALDRALSALELFSLIGFLEDVEGLVRRFEAVFGARLVLHRYNEAKGGEARLTAEQIDRLRVMCASDQALYDRARALMAKAPGHAAA